MADERETESGDEGVDEQGRNPTQRRMDEEGVEPVPVDASWTGEPEAAAASRAESEPGAPNEPIFEPDVPLVAEVNREAGRRPRKGLVAAAGGAFALLGAVLLRRRR